MHEEMIFLRNMALVIVGAVAVTCTVILLTIGTLSLVSHMPIVQAEVRCIGPELP